MSRRHFILAVVGTLSLIPSLGRAADVPAAVWLEPSLHWHGIDGNWSSTTLFVGEPAQEVDVVVSTSLSEIWVVENSGCASPLCNDARGGVFDRNASTSWSPMGLWQLGLKAIGIHANGDYAKETVVVYDSVRRWQTSFDKLLVAGINDTSAYTGFFGLGITEGNFGGVVAQGPITSLVQQSGTIPSHSYGYTPGAYYAGANGVPMSLTLGGYDANRFEPHDTRFSLNSTTRQPQVLVRAITASVSDVEQAPTEWSTASMPLLSYNESVTAMIDSSTPYLWLPSHVCDRFASALNLTWNETLGLYVFSNNDVLDSYRSAPGLSFTFTFSSADNTGNFGAPTNMTGIVNITVSANAFIQSLQYPFMNHIDYGAPAIPYFPLKRAENSSQLTIGRSFLQEAYMITNYETSTFSIHKARFPDNPLRNTSIFTIAHSLNSPYPGPPIKEESKGITQNQIAGVVVGLCLGAIALVTTIVLVRRRKRAFKDNGNENEPQEYKEKYCAAEPESPISPTTMTLFRMKTRAKSCPKKTTQAEGPVDAHEVGADWSHERYEMPAQMPVELDATDTTTSAYFAVPAGEDTLGENSYKRPQQWAQLTQPADSEDQSKSSGVNSRAAHVPPPINTQYRDSPSPTSSPTQENDISRMPSPITPRSDGSTYFGDYPSPIAGFFPARTLSRSTISNPTMAYTPPSPTGASDSTMLARSASSVTSIRSQATVSVPQPPIQRTPIDSTNVVCLGPLPDNVRFPHQMMVQRPPGSQNHDLVLPTMPTIASENPSRRHSTADTLGSNFTLEEEARVAAVTRGDAACGRIDGFDIVHVPQMAHRRYSWEEEER
ncbi:aspartic peptidase domain-containing protein [Xylaria bambusicola]|uniref:aspartic peptidase domain-containing protein n=1 Tax=Xylaria bambusicola TaxID=326684 RepID=UPI002007C88E|nr:aspartic peptidase domain-containing protein [Xylaria bambusicola]KAI0525762.1 aspartic peptidase domain-containing protein [Xylaria bambusicola]